MGRYYDTYEWTGSPHGRVTIDSMFVDDLKQMPWKLVELDDEYDPLFDRRVFIRADVSFWWISFLQSKWHCSWLWFSSRMAMTLYVWGLAYVPQYMSVSLWSALTHERAPLGKLIKWWRQP